MLHKFYFHYSSSPQSLKLLVQSCKYEDGDTKSCTNFGDSDDDKDNGDYDMVMVG